MKTRISPIFLAPALALALASPLAFAHPGDEAAEHAMKMHMHDMTPEQQKMMANKMWADMDANHDGMVSRMEYDQHVARMMAMHEHEGMGKDDDATEAPSHASKEAAEDQAKAAHEASEADAHAAHEAAEKH